MIVKTIRVQSFRSIQDETLICDALTALVGRNGTGKSTFLRSLELFYAPSARIDPDDFYNRDTTKPIVVAVTFKVVSAEAKGLFANYIEEDTLTIERVIRWNDGKGSSTLHGSRLQAKDFSPIREGESAASRKVFYEKLREQAAYSDLPAWKKQDQALEALTAWEATHAAALERLRDDGQFFGFAEVAQGYLGRFTRLLSVPAVRDAAIAAEEGRGAILTDLVDLVVRSVIARKDALIRLREETQKTYEAILDPEELTELPALQGDLTRTLQTFVPDASVSLFWKPLEAVSIPLPKAEVKLVEDQFEASVDRTGHGLQRAFLMTLLQHLTIAQATLKDGRGVEDHTAREDATAVLPNLVLGIEEPELYQHPNRQRHLALILLKLASGTIPGVAKTTQVVYATHSPYFVGIDRVNQIRLLRKAPGVADGSPRITRIASTTLDRVAEILWQANGAHGARFTADTLRPRLQAVLTPWMSEGFFADTVVLVEGEDDRAALVGAAMRRGVNLDSAGVSVLPCGGKTSMDRPAVVFRELGIRTYLVWDNDRCEPGASAEDNHRLLRLQGKTVEDWPAGVHDDFACFDGCLEKTLQAELGIAEYEASLSQAQTELVIPKRKNATKNPALVARAIEIAAAAGKRSATLDAILDKVLNVVAPNIGQMIDGHGR